MSGYLDDMEIDVLLTRDPTVGLPAAAALARLAERMTAVHVANARAHGWTWAQIAEALDVSKQAVHQKYRHLEED